MLTDTSLARYAGRFVWLTLDFDSADNAVFLAQHEVTNTPSFFILDPADERVTATQLGAMALPEVVQFLERGERGVLAKAQSPADAALARGDELLASNQHAEAAAVYHEAIRLGGKTWRERARAVGSFTWALMSSKQWQPCAETAEAEGPDLPRNAMFGRVVVAGMWCVNSGEPAPWAEAAAKILEPLAAEAAALPATVRDHRFQLYQNLMYLGNAHGDKAIVVKWGNLWLKELDGTKPANDDERSALDIARADAASILGDPSRVLPALTASERAMPNNYNASLRLAQMEIDAKRYDEAIAACDRGLKHVTGPLGQAWLLQTKADALLKKGDPAEAYRVLEEALRAAQTIAGKQSRENNVTRITHALKETQAAAK
jgi:tetratricopeptide (TPR) repeat protein